MTDLQSKLLIAICSKSYRGEASLCRQFDRNWKGWRASDAQSEAVEDALYQLVRTRYADWFGDNLRALKYRGTPKGQRWFAAQNKAA